jgi:hypothetical protein
MLDGYFQDIHSLDRLEFLAVFSPPKNGRKSQFSLPHSAPAPSLALPTARDGFLDALQRGDSSVHAPGPEANFAGCPQMIAKYGLRAQSRPDRMAGFRACGAAQDGLLFEGQRNSHAVV